MLLLFIVYYGAFCLFSKYHNVKQVYIYAWGILVSDHWEAWVVIYWQRKSVQTSQRTKWKVRHAHHIYIYILNVNTSLHLCRRLLSSVVDCFYKTRQSWIKHFTHIYLLWRGVRRVGSINALSYHIYIIGSHKRKSIQYEIGHNGVSLSTDIGRVQTDRVV